MEAFWAAGLAAGLDDDGIPGLRPQYGDDYHAAYLRDADANSLEAVLHTATPRRGLLDHVTVRVADLAATGLDVRREPGASAIVSGRPGDALLLLPGEPTAGLHHAYPAREEAIRRYYDDATGAAYRGNGEPGPRPQHTLGNFAAFVLDPDGCNVELVEHRTT